LARVAEVFFVVHEDETMNGSYRINVVERRCLPLDFMPRRHVALRERTTAHITT
jgi:hypothetical protein